MNLIKQTIKDIIKQFDESNESKVFTFDDLMAVEYDLKNNLNKLKNHSNKGSRFSHLENLQNVEVSDQTSSSVFGGSAEQVSFIGILLVFNWI